MREKGADLSIRNTVVILMVFGSVLSCRKALIRPSKAPSESPTEGMSFPDEPAESVEGTGTSGVLVPETTDVSEPDAGSPFLSMAVSEGTQDGGVDGDCSDGSFTESSPVEPSSETDGEDGGTGQAVAAIKVLVSKQVEQVALIDAQTDDIEQVVTAYRLGRLDRYAARRGWTPGLPPPDLAPRERVWWYEWAKDQHIVGAIPQKVLLPVAEAQVVPPFSAAAPPEPVPAP